MMWGGTRNGRALKLALLVGLVLLTLYFLVSWKREAQTLSTNLELAEQEYATIIGRYNTLEKHLKESIQREAGLGKDLEYERDRGARMRQEKVDFEAKCRQTIESKTNQILVLEEEKTELKEQLEAVKADRDSKAQDVQRLNEELRDAKDHAEDEYRALSASCVQKQQTCDKQAKEAEGTISNLRMESETNHQSLVDCQAKLSVEQDTATSCNARLTSLEREGANRLNEIEQMQSQLHQAQQDKALLMSQLHERQNSDEGEHKAGEVREEERHVLQHDVRKRYVGGDGGGGGEELVKRNVYGGKEFGQRSQRDSVPAVGDGDRNQRWQFPGAYDRRGEGDSLEAKRSPGHGHQINDFHNLDRANVGLNDKIELPVGGADRRQEMEQRKVEEGRERFSDVKLTDEQKWNVFESLQGKLSRGERLDDRQQRIYDILLKDFQHAEKPPAAAKNFPVRYGMVVDDNYHQDAAQDDDGVQMGGKKEDQLPNPLDAREEEVKDLVEEAQKPGEFDNLGGRGQEEREEEREEQVGGGGEDLERGQDGGVDDERDENYLREDDEEEEGEKKVADKVDDNPLPRPGQEENPDDEDAGNGDKAGNNAADQEDMYGEQMYKQDKEQFQRERLPKNFDRQL